MNIGMQIQALRSRDNITREKLAADLGVTLKTIRKWEDNITLPNIKMLCRLADYFRVTTDELMGRDIRGTFMVCADTLTAPVLQYLLEKENFLCSAVVADGIQLKRCLEKCIPHILLLEIPPASENGPDLLREIRENYPSVRIIVFTESPSEESRQKAVSCGADACIVKPFAPELLMKTLKMLGF